MKITSHIHTRHAVSYGNNSSSYRLHSHTNLPPAVCIKSSQLVAERTTTAFLNFIRVSMRGILLRWGALCILPVRVLAATTDCYNDCSGHGTCTSATKLCTCQAGWGAATDVTLYRSPDCSQRKINHLLYTSSIILPIPVILCSKNSLTSSRRWTISWIAK